MDALCAPAADEEPSITCICRPVTPFEGPARPPPSRAPRKPGAAAESQRTERTERTERVADAACRCAQASRASTTGWGWCSC